MILNQEDTICAISTASGPGAIALIRLSGSEAIQTCDKVFKSATTDKILTKQNANTIHYGSIYDNNVLIDDVLISLFKAPNSYTGEDIAEISCHGSPFIQQKILEAVIKKGARLAQPGEFTKRAFLNGKLDLSQAEGVADLIASGSEAAHKLAISQMRGGFSTEINNLRGELLNFISLIELELDFSEEDVEFADRKALTELINKIENLLSGLITSFEYGNAIKNGIPVAILGRTNAGKSTLLNLLLREEKAIVSHIEGTTRDLIEDTIVVDGIQFRFIDTAGLRETSDHIENIGIERALEKFDQAEIVIVVIDVNDSVEEIAKSLDYLHKRELEGKYMIYTINKIDTVKNAKNKVDEIRKQLKEGEILTLSAKEKTNFKQLEEALIHYAKQKAPEGIDVVVSNVRHFEALNHAHEAIIRACEGVQNQLPTDLMAQDIREVLHYLGEITGEITTDEILGNIFKNFCIGK